MSVIFSDLQDCENPLNGTIIRDYTALRELLEGQQGKLPFICSLDHASGFQLDVGVGVVGCVQHSRGNGDPPFLEALSPDGGPPCEYVEFLLGNTPTPVAGRKCLPFDLVITIAVHFMETGDTYPGVAWEPVGAGP